MENSREVSQKAKNRITIWPSNFTPGYTSNIPGSGRSPEEGHGSPFQYFCLENSMNKGVWWSTKSQILLKQLSMNTSKNKVETLIQKDTGTPMFTAALFTIARRGGHPSRWMEKEDMVHSIQWRIIQSFRSVQLSCSAMSASVWPHGLQHAGFPVHHQLLELTQTHVHWVSDAIQPSHPLSSPSPPAFNLSQHQGLFKWVSSSNQVAKVLEFQLQHQSFQRTPRTELL